MVSDSVDLENTPCGAPRVPLSNTKNLEESGILVRPSMTISSSRIYPPGSQTGATHE
jgi:hypothetical protein